MKLTESNGEISSNAIPITTNERPHDNQPHESEEIDLELDPPTKPKKGRSFRLPKNKHVTENIDRFRRTMSLRGKKKVIGRS